MGTVVSNSSGEEFHEQIKTNKSNNLASVERTNVRRRELQKARKAVKPRQTVGAAMTKQRVEKMC